MIPRTVAAALMGALLLAALDGPAGAQTKITVSEVLRSQFYLPMYVALAKGFTKEEGLEVDVISAGGGDRAGALMLSAAPRLRWPAPRLRSTSTTASPSTSR